MIYHKLKLPSTIISQVLKSTHDELINRGEDQVVYNQMGFLKVPRKLLHYYFINLGLPPVRSCILFSRPAMIEQTIHLDCSSDEELVKVNCAINFPIENCDDSFMQWYQGDYNIVVKEFTGPDDIKRKYVDLNWKTPPELIEKTIIDHPTLVNVSIPHNVNTIPRHRKLLTCRFMDNPTYQEVYDVLKRNDLIAS